MRPRRHRAARAAYVVLLAGWCAGIWWLSDSSDPEDLTGVRLQLPDKVEHAIAYAAGGLLAAGAVSEPRRLTSWVPAVAFCAAWGALDEIHQSWVPGRDASGADLAADVVGASLGALAWRVRPWRGRESPLPADGAGGAS